MHTRVSIITPYYQGASFIGRALASVRAQTYTAWEHVIVDDGSPDDASTILRPYLEEDTRRRLVTQQNAGECAARNTGYAASTAKSSYLLFLDQDDMLEPDMLAVLVTYLDAHPTLTMAFGDRLLIDDTDRPLPVERQTPLARYVPGRWGPRLLPDMVPETPLASFLVYNRLNPSGALLCRRAYDRAGGWDTSLLQSGEDTDLWMRLTLLMPAHYIPRVLVKRRMHTLSVLGSIGAQEQRAREDLMLTKWRRGEGLATRERIIVQDAFRFRDRVFLPWLFASYGADAFRQGRLGEGMAQYARAARRLVAA